MNVNEHGLCEGVGTAWKRMLALEPIPNLTEQNGTQIRSGASSGHSLLYIHAVHSSVAVMHAI